MITSRSLDDLKPEVKQKAEAFIAACALEGIDLLVTCTYRDYEAQNALYNQGRRVRGNVVTNAKGGYSYHNFRCAFDVVPLRNGKPVWGTVGMDFKLWQQVGKIGKAQGLEWAGDWREFREYPHFQYTGGLSLAQLRRELQKDKETATA